MPLLPSNNMNVNAPDMGVGPSVQRAGQTWDAVAHVGNSIMNFGSELAAKRKQAETETYISQNANELEREVSNKMDELKQKYPGDPTGMTNEMHDHISNWYQERSQNAPNSDAKALWERKFADHAQNIGRMVDAEENKQRINYQVGVMDESVNKDAQHLANKPDPKLAAQFITNTSAMVKGGVGLWYDKTHGQERLNKYGSSTAKALMEGLEANKQYGIGLSIFDGKDPNSKIIMEHMTPDQISGYKDRFGRLAQAESEVSKHTLNLQANDVQTALMSGMKVPDSTFNSLIDNSKNMKPEDRAVFVDNLNVSRHYGDILSQMKTLPVEDMQKFVGYRADHGKDNIFNLTARTKMGDEFQKTAAKIIDQRKNQAPEFWAENDQNVKLASMAAMDPQNPGAMDQYAKMITAKKMADKSSSTQILTPDMSKSYAALLKANNPQAANTFRNALEKGYGSSFGNVVNDMVKNGHITEDFAMAMHLNDEGTRAGVFENLVNKKTIETAYEARADKTKGEENELFSNSKVLSLKQAMIANSGSAKDLWVNNGIDSLLKLEYKAARVGGMNEDDSAKAAIKKVISNNFDVATYGKSSVPLMGKYKTLRDDAENFMESGLSTPTLNKLNLAVPQSYLDHSQKSGSSPEEARSRYLNELSTNGKWVLNDAQNGLRLVKLNPNGQAALPKDKDGKPFEVKFEDMKSFMMNMETQRKSEIDKLRGL
jgi:hypothetical protein